MSVFIYFILLIHGGFHEQIILVNEEIKNNPASPELYYKRAKLYFHHEMYDSCIVDLKYAYQGGLESDIGYTYLSKSYYYLDYLDSSQYYLNQIRDKTRIKYLTESIQGDIFFKTKQYYQAANSYEIALEHTIRPRPENFGKIIQTYKTLSTDDGDKLAIHWCQKAIQHHGHLPIFHQYLMEIYLNHQAYHKAISLELEYSNNLNRKESSYYKLAELYYFDNDYYKAKIYIDKVNECINKLKPNQRNNRATEALIQKMNNLRNKLK